MRHALRAVRAWDWPGGIHGGLFGVACGLLYNIVLVVAGVHLTAPVHTYVLSACAGGAIGTPICAWLRSRLKRRARR